MVRNNELNEKEFGGVLREAALKEKSVTLSVEDSVKGFVLGSGTFVDRKYVFKGGSLTQKNLRYDNDPTYHDEREEDIRDTVTGLLSPYDIFNIGVEYEAENRANVLISVGMEFEKHI